jgi:hypothetical protein
MGQILCINGTIRAGAVREQTEIQDSGQREAQAQRLLGYQDAEVQVKDT